MREVVFLLDLFNWEGPYPPFCHNVLWPEFWSRSLLVLVKGGKVTWAAKNLRYIWRKKNVKLRFPCFLCNVVLTGGIHDRYNARNDACWTQQLLIDTIKTFRPSYSLWIFWSFIKHKPTFRVAICNNDWYSFHFLVGESKLIFARVHSYVPNRVRFMLTKTRVGFFSFFALDIWQGKVLITSAFVNYFMSRTPTEGFDVIRLFTYYFIFSWRAATWIQVDFPCGRNWKVMKNEEIIRYGLWCIFVF